MKDANSFTSALSPYVSDPELFIVELCKSTNGFVKNGGISSTKEALAMKQSRKRCRGEIS